VYTGSIGVDAREILVVTQAGFEYTLLGIVGSVILTSNTVVNMLTKVCCVLASGVADFETELIRPHKVVPFNHLLIRATECSRIYKTAEWITTQVCTMGIHLTPIVTSGQIDLGLVDESHNLHVVGGLHKLDALQGTLGYNTSSTTSLGTPCNHFPFYISN